MLYCSSSVCGMLLNIVLVTQKNSKGSKLISLIVKFKLLIGDTNRQRPCGNPNVLSPNLVVAVASDFWPVLLLFQSAPGWPTALCL